MIMSIPKNACFVNSITAQINNTTIKSLNNNDLENINNYFEIVYGDKPIRPYIDLDGELQNYSMYEFQDTDAEILKKLKTIPNVSILTSSKYNSVKYNNKNEKLNVNKLSYRITYYNEICYNIKECRHLIQNYKYPELKSLLQDTIELKEKKDIDCLNIDYNVYRSKGKMRCVNAYKDNYDKDRINKLVLGNISQTIISAYNNMNDEILNDMLETKEDPINIKNDFENMIFKPIKNIKSKTKIKSKKIIELEKEIKQELKKERETEIKNNENNNENIYSYLDNYHIKYYIECIDINKLSYEDWIKLTIAYKKCNGNFEDYKKWNMKSPEFSIKGLTKLWNHYEDDIKCTLGTIKYYAKLYDPKKYEYISKMVHNTYELIHDNCTEKNIAMLYIYKNYENLYPFDGLNYLFLNNKWYINSSMDMDLIREDLSIQLTAYLKNIINYLNSIIENIETDPVETNPIYDPLRRCINKTTEVVLIVNKTQWLNNITREIKCILKTQQLNNNDIFDKKPYLFAFKNCVFDIQTKEQLDFDKKMYITMNNGLDYIEPTELQMKTIDDLFISIFPNPEIRKCYLSILKNSLTGIRLENFFIANGCGRNGKGLLNELQQHLLGTGKYFYKLPVDVLTKDFNNMGANPQLANCNNKRLILSSEPKDGCSLKMNTIKNITGSATINARGLYESNTTVNMNMTLIMECNQKPMIDGNIDEAIVERIIDIPFENTFTFDDAKVDEENGVYKANKLYKEDSFKNTHYSALFKYILLEAEDDLYIPPIIKKRSAQYVMDNDDFYGWFQENYEITKKVDDIVKVKDIYNNYKESSLFMNMNKKQKRHNNFKNFVETIKHHIILKKMYKENDTQVGKKRITGKRVHGLVQKNMDYSDSD